MKLANVRIFAFPAWADNPYLNLLYLASRAAGAEVRGTTLLSSLETELAGAHSGDVLHIHWTAPICQAASSESDARARLKRFMHAVRKAKAAGLVMVWTVHNAIPHDAAYLKQELELLQFLADTADLIHIMTEETPEVVGEYYRLPEQKLTLIPHSSYQGIYGSHRTRESAREHFGIHPTDKAVLFFGQMRPYKGLDTLLAAVEAAHSDNAPIVLLLAGKTPPGSLEILESLLPTSARVIRDHTFIADADVDLWFTAADITVFPYRKILNSGSVHLASTYGVPCILPKEAHLQTQFANERWVTFFDRYDEAASLASVLRAWEDSDGAKRRAALEAAARFTPYEMSTAFAGSLGALTAGGTSSPQQRRPAAV